jgi:hypothetical protein
MKKFFIVLYILLSVLMASNCTKKASPTFPATDENPGLNATLTYLATAGVTAQAVATQTMEIQQTATTVAAAQKTANAEATYDAVHGTNTPTINTTATAQMNNAVATATAQMAATIAYLAQADPAEQAAATLTQTIAIGNATATVAAQKTVKAEVTVLIVTASYTDTPTNIVAPTNTNTPTPSTTPAPLPIVIGASLYYYDNDSPGWYCNIGINDANYNAISDAIVTLKNVTKSQKFTSTCSNGNYSISIIGIDPGNTVEMDVYFGGVTYTASGVMPGGSTLNPDGNTLTWLYGGNSNYVNIYDPSDNNIYSQAATGSSLDISSYYPVAGVAGEYNVELEISKDLTFTGGASSSSNFHLDCDSSWDVDVILDSKYAVPTPTPMPATTAPSIMAEIISDDLEGGVSVQDMVMVTDSEGNAVTNAGVTIKNITAGTQIHAVYSTMDEFGTAYYPTSGATCIPGDTYEFDVCVSGITYTAQVTAPVASGNLSADCFTLSWTNNGNYNSVGAGNNFYKANNPGNSLDISSIYTSDGTYDVTLVLANVYSNGSFEGFPFSPGIFAGAAPSSMAAIGYQYEWEVEAAF